jgi:hypothetical protein
MSEIGDIKETARSAEYARWALAARKQYLLLRRKQDLEITALYRRAMSRIASMLRDTRSEPEAERLKGLAASLADEERRIREGLTRSIKVSISAAVEATTGYTKGVFIDLVDKAGAGEKITVTGVNKLFAQANTQAIEAMWARSRNGLFLSDRIWSTAGNAREAIAKMVQEGVAVGMDPVKLAKMLTRYVNADAATFAEQYPNMMQRMKGRVPKQLNYEALRLARTETAAAAGEGTILAAMASPSAEGVKWVLSRAHPKLDVCDERAGGGPARDGVYPPAQVPRFPSHPNCLCHLQVVNKSPEEFVTDLKAWLVDFRSQPEIEKWYEEIYTPASMGIYTPTVIVREAHEVIYERGDDEE